MEADRRTGGGATPPPGDAWNALSFLLTGILLFGGIGWGLDALFGTRWCTPVGLLAGGTAAMYLIYVRYVK
jgi:F0F1-type ATP synthase assembly protein I